MPAKELFLSEQASPQLILLSGHEGTCKVHTFTIINVSGSKSNALFLQVSVCFLLKSSGHEECTAEYPGGIV